MVVRYSDVRRRQIAGRDATTERNTGADVAKTATPRCVMADRYYALHRGSGNKTVLNFISAKVREHIL